MLSRPTVMTFTRIHQLLVPARALVTVSSTQPRTAARPAHVKSTLPRPDPPRPGSLSGWVFSRLEDRAGLPGLVSGQTSLSQLDTWAQSLRLGSSLLDLGLQPGMVVATVLPNKTELPVAVLGATEVGLAVAPICPASSTESICRQLVSSGASAVITTGELAGKVEKAGRYYGLLEATVLVLEAADGEEGSLVVGGNTRDWAGLVERDVETWPELEPAQHLELPALLAWSGGRHHAAFTHRQLLAGLAELEELWRGGALQGAGQQITALVTVPATRPSSIAAILFHLSCGHRVVIDRKCPSLAGTLEQYKPSVYHLGPVGAQWVADTEMAGRLGSVRQLVLHTTAAPLEPATLEKLQRQLGPGSTAAQLLCRQEVFTASHWCSLPGTAYSAGLPLPGAECRVVGQDGTTVTSHTVGRLLVRGPSVMAGLWHRGAVHTEPLLQTEGWFDTGDSAYCDEHSNTFLVDVHPYNGKFSYRTCKYGKLSGSSK